MKPSYMWLSTTTRRITRFVILISLLLFVFSIVGTMYIQNLSRLLNEETNMHLSEINEQGAARVKNHFEQKIEVLRVLSSGFISDPDIPIENKMDRLLTEVERNSFFQLVYATPDGKAYSTDGTSSYINKYQFFNESIKGKEYVTEPMSIGDKAPFIICSVPIYSNGEVSGLLYGSIELHKLAEEINFSFFGGNGLSYVVDSSGRVILHPTINHIQEIIGGEIEDRFSQAPTNYLSEFQNNGKGTIRSEINGIEAYISYSPIEGISDWMMISIAPVNVVFGISAKIIEQTICIIVSLVIIFLLILTYIIYNKRKSEKEIYKLAFKDNLTEIGNFNKFSTDCEKKLDNKKGKKYAFIYFDIDNFKVINDTFGYTSGDKVLNYVANTLKDISDNKALYARFSNDHFAILYEYETKCQVTDFIAFLQKKLNRVLLDEQINIDLVLSVGIYLIENDDYDFNLIYNKGNMARVTIKGQQKVQFAFYNEEIRHKLFEEIEMQNEIRMAISSNKFEVYYQPKYDLKKEKIVGAEALIRWNHPCKGFISPAVFIPVAEKTGMIIDIGRGVFTEVCRTLAEWEQKGIHPLPISVNMSRVELYQSELLSFLKDRLDTYKIPRDVIEIELTETCALNDLDHFISMIYEFQMLGFKISLDDFGTGYSSFSYLNSIPIDILKLDRSFFIDIEHDIRSQNIAKSIVTLAKSLNLIVVAEGIETIEQVAFLKKMDCDIAQGFYFGKPMPKDEMEKLLLANQ
ncbi:bifunctional diguanylate cyclase/phosphodiesterase [Brevibacillus daliensis]|uniref:bifunctional diguanylate cyclase/phosphodiesterase n=1 Tax=Brevibacillus daliensis TaxID=2892995 RepID=UPI001E56973C|nr:EAL domain-containing protein [Brevibacillus daliensis]